ncbi:TetR family transcriptional regulator [Rhizobium sp. CFBP 8762]|uniref:TetR family transcriptional regulator n=1 Tax=Rhizobium sp. CFBP 8762 TaxID=2775279 RepID=UPI0017814971|nr:TetR family transcriptional regulator [Rhizobium sp. CFBP 8762]MBD8553711.1 TetR family transcriptional regulator [Rhizobium sp. CFBP 8762]
MTAPQPNKRQLILDTALDIIESNGIKALTQPRLSKLSGIRQSHLTYYFPRKADLYIALLEASHQRAQQGASTTGMTVAESLASLFFDPERMRFLLSIILEVGDDPELQAILKAHAQNLCASIAMRVGRAPDDADVSAFIDELRGLGLRALMQPHLRTEHTRLIADAATRNAIVLSE